MTDNLTVRTDKSNYSPGETARITATGFGVGSTITFAIADDPSDFGDDGDRDFYTLSPNPITDGGVGDLDGNANGEVVTTWFVPTDNNGTGSGTPDALNGTLNLTATGPDGQAATTMFMDGNQNLWAWRNQPGPTLNTWNAGTTIQQTNSIYAEGEVIPFRWTIATGNPAPQLQEGVTYTILLDWAYAGGTTSPQKLFFDYLTSYDATEITSPAFGADSGLSAGFLNGYITTKEIPNDTGDTGGTPPNPATVAHPAGNFTLYNIDPNSVIFSPYIADPVNANQEDRRLNITFTPSDNDGTVNEFLDVGVAWGGHLATQKDYGFQNGAASFPGASPQMVVDLNPSVSGDQTNLNINPNAIVPQEQITIIKDAVPNDSQDFGFTITGPTGANITPTFTLDDDSDSTLSNQITFFGLVEGVYTITEDSTSGWSLTGITPTENGVKDTTTSDISSTNVGGRTATITVANGEVWTVKFTNEPANQPSFSIAKDVTSVTGGAGLSADSAGDVINYSIVLTNTGNQSLTGVTLEDPFATTVSAKTESLSNNNILDVGETWSYTATHTVTQAEIDAGKILTNVATGDTEQTTPKSDDATTPVVQTPNFTIAKDVTSVTGGAGLSADSAGDVINYSIVLTNTGNQSLTGVTLEDPFATTVSAKTESLSNNNILDVGETWSYTATHTVTQAEIDAGKILTNVATGDTEQTTPKSDDATTPVVQTPAIEVIKTAGAITDVDNNGQDAGDTVNYTYKVTNTGNVTLNPVTLVDDNGIPLNTADNVTITLTDNNLDPGEFGTGSYTYKLTQTDIDAGFHTNIALATGTTPGGDPVTGTDTNTVNLTRTGDLKITKTDYLTKVVPGQCVTYTIVVSNCGPDTATHALVEDLFPSNLTDVKWTSKAAKGATDNKARGTDNIEDYVTLPAGSSITYKVTGTVVGGPGSHKVSDCHRTLTNTATVTAPSDFTDTNLENNTATDIDTIMAAPGVHNAHFWQNTKWQKSWDGIQGNEHSQKTRPNFPDSDLLLSPYTNSARSGKVLDPITRRYGVGLLIGDYNHNGKTDKKENTLFYTRAQALQIVDSSMHPNNRDTRYILGRDLVTSWLNYLAGNSIDTPNSNDQDARDYINEGIQWLQALTPDQNRDGKGDGYLQGLTGNETSNSRTPRILATSSYWKSGISSASNLPNSYKSNTDVLYPIDAGISIHTHLDNYNNNIF
jgi:uncharacterized repeat protein (TIGR01451 family)